MRKVRTSDRNTTSNISKKGSETSFSYGRFEFTFPNGEYPPASGLQGYPLLLVVGYITSYLIHPELGTGFWDNKIAAALMLVPETTMNEDNRLVLW